MNMQRHLEEQTRELDEREEQPRQHAVNETCSLPSCSKKRAKVSFHDMQRDDDQAEIAQLIETDPYFAAAMEDFAHSHGLLSKGRHR